MKYTRMVCWVNLKEKQYIKNTNLQHNIPIIFAKNYDEFRSLINENSYLVLSIMKAKFSYNKVCNLVQEYPNFLFHVIRRLDDAFTTKNEYSFLAHEINVIHKQYDAIDLINEYLY
jgi:hypothetical protein